MTGDDLETVLWLLGVTAIIAASAVLWGLVGGLFAFGAVFVGWVMWKQLLMTVRR